MRSGWLAARIFGMISLNTSSTKVMPSVPSSRVNSLAPNSRMTTTLVTAAAATFNRVLPNRIEPSSLSTLASNREVSFALLFPFADQVVKAIAVDRHHRGFRGRKPCAEDYQQQQHAKQRA